MTVAELKAYIAARIKANGQKAITGSIQQDVLLKMADVLATMGGEAPRKTILNCYGIVAQTYQVEDITKAEFAATLGLTEDGVDTLLNTAPEFIYIAGAYGSSKSFTRFTQGGIGYDKVLKGENTDFSYEDETNKRGILDPTIADCVEIRLNWEGEIITNGVSIPREIALGFTSTGYYIYIHDTRPM